MTLRGSHSEATEAHWEQSLESSGAKRQTVSLHKPTHDLGIIFHIQGNDGKANLIYFFL